MLMPGSYLINRYEIMMKIGSGGMADVYKAKDHVLNRLVAIKVLKQEYSTDATFVKKFRVEAQSAAGLSHPNIVNVYDVGEDNGVYFIVMELVQGITLKNYIDMKGKLDIREALNISVQIASGLSAAHDNRIIHRDIKPQNIIMSRDGKVKVTDFGIAKVADSTTVTTTAAGTVHYISPEQARGGYSDEKSDIYSLGITMYEMVTGRVPFEGETNVAVALMHIQSEMTPPRQLEPSIPVSFEKIILKCTQKKPERRYASARELIADLRKVLTHPDGEYVVIPGAIPQGRTIVMNDNDIDSLKAASLRKNLGTKPEETYVAETEEDEEEEKPVQKPVQKKRPVKKKDLASIMMSYGYVYVAQVAMGADMNQCLKAMHEAESYHGPSIVIAYAPCINHGIKGGMGVSMNEEKKAVAAGYWHTFRFDPRRADNGQNPFQLDSKKPSASYRDFIMGEVRYNSLTRSFPQRAEQLFEKAEKYAEEKYEKFAHMASEEE